MDVHKTEVERFLDQVPRYCGDLIRLRMEKIVDTHGFLESDQLAALMGPTLAQKFKEQLEMEFVKTLH